MAGLPMTELRMTELLMTEPPIKDYDGGAFSEAIVCAAAALAHTWYSQKQLWRILGMRSSSFDAYLDCAKASDAHSYNAQK